MIVGGHQSRVGPPHVRPVLELRAVEFVERPQHRQVEQPADPDHLAMGDLKFAHQQVEQVVVDVVTDLEADGRAEPPAGQFAFEGLEEVLGLVLLDLQVGVAGHPEQVGVHHLHAGEELREVGGDDFFQRDEADLVVVVAQVVREVVAAHARRGLRDDPDQPGHVLRDLHAGEPVAIPAGVTYSDCKVEGESADVGEGVRRVDRERGEDGEDLLVEVVVQPVLLPVGQVVPQLDGDARLGQSGDDGVGEAPRVTLAEIGRGTADEVELFARGEAVGG